jgi:hypothetical protein
VDRLRFWSLYAACLALCLGLVEGLQLAIPQAAAAVELNLATDFVAVPPKPRGADTPTRGEGDGAVYTEEACRVLTGDFRDACFHFLALQRVARDLAGARAACAAIGGESLRWECEADLGELHSREDRVAAEQLCGGIPKKKWRDQCIFGIAMQWSTGDPDFARGACDRAGMWRDFCRHDVNGEVAQVDPQAALDWCNSQLGDGSQLQRKTCFHGLGKYVGRTDPPRALELCREVPIDDPLYRENCFHGIGWAVAETDSDAALALCTREGGAWEDSCRLGVSAHARRLDPARALALCAGVGRTDLRVRCEAFARR